MEQPKEDVGTQKDLCFYRIRAAKENLRSARILLDADEYREQITGLIMLFLMQ